MECLKKKLEWISQDLCPFIVQKKMYRKVILMDSKAQP